MGMEMRQELKLSQQLVMTPQLQQAIRLLQLSRMELAELVHDEMLENPILDDEVDLEHERSDEKDLMGGDEQALHQLEGAGSTETPIEGSVQDGVAQTEIKGDATAVNEIDWENYLDNYSMGPPMPAFRGDGEELPSLEATLTKPASLHDHLAWQLKMTNLPQEQLEIGLETTATSRTRRSRSSLLTSARIQSSASKCSRRSRASIPSASARARSPSAC
jgi:RNA polymerase sigma-54 factor